MSFAFDLRLIDRLIQRDRISESIQKIMTKSDLLFIIFSFLDQIQVINFLQVNKMANSYKKIAKIEVRILKFKIALMNKTIQNQNSKRIPIYPFNYNLRYLFPKLTNIRVLQQTKSPISQKKSIIKDQFNQVQSKQQLGQNEYSHILNLYNLAVQNKKNQQLLNQMKASYLSNFPTYQFIKDQGKVKKMSVEEFKQKQIEDYERKMENIIYYEFYKPLEEDYIQQTRKKQGLLKRNHERLKKSYQRIKSEIKYILFDDIYDDY